MIHATRPARLDDLSGIAPVALRAGVVRTGEELVDILAAEPWRVRVSDRGEAAILGRWREHLSDCAILGLWCGVDRIPAVVADLSRVAAAEGYDRLLGPLIPDTRSAPYVAAGMCAVERVLTLRLDRLGRFAAACEAQPPEGVIIRQAGPQDLEAMMAIDHASFEPFWRYDQALLGRYLRDDRSSVAERGGVPIGYTLATARSSEACLGRLAVTPQERRLGTGRALVFESVTWMARQRARSVTLSTQEGNQPSRRLYRDLGFRELPGALIVCASGPLRPTG